MSRSKIVASPMLVPLLHGSLVLGLLLSWAAPAEAASRADPEKFFLRLTDMGFKTAYLRSLALDIDIHFRQPTSTAEAQWGYIRNKLYIPDRFREAGSDFIRYDLASDEINTLIHELSHAAYDLRADENGHPDSTNYIHWSVVDAIWADIFLAESEASVLGLPRYPRFKADEVVSYYIGAAIGSVFDGAKAIISYNEFALDDQIKAPEDAEALGDRLVLPAKDHPQDYRRRLANLTFWEHKAGGDAAYFEGKAIPWKQRSCTKLEIFDHVLGLDPPRDAASLVKRLNESRSDWMDGVRERIAAARRRFAEELRLRLQAGEEALEPSHDGVQNGS